MSVSIKQWLTVLIIKIFINYIVFQLWRGHSLWREANPSHGVGLQRLALFEELIYMTVGLIEELELYILWETLGWFFEGAGKDKIEKSWIKENNIGKILRLLYDWVTHRVHIGLFHSQLCGKIQIRLMTLFSNSVIEVLPTPVQQTGGCRRTDFNVCSKTIRTAYSATFIWITATQTGPDSKRREKGCGVHHA